jgi:hypothetical protein
VERAGRDAAVVARHEPQLVQAVRTRVAQAVDLDRHLATDTGGLHRGADPAVAAAQRVPLP